MAYVRQEAFGNWFTDVVKSVVPSHTIVGKALSGDWGGAAQATVKLAAPAKAKPVVVAPPQPGQPGYVAPGIFAPGGFVDQNKMALLGVAGVLAVVLVMKRR